MMLVVMVLATVAFVVVQVADIITTNHPGGVEGNGIIAAWMRLTGKWWPTIKLIGVPYIYICWKVAAFGGIWPVAGVALLFAATAAFVPAVYGNMKINGQVG